MDIKENLEQVKRKFEQIKRKHHFKKENKRREQKAQLTKDLVDCAGDLGVCLKDYERSIRHQSAQIRQGRAQGFPVSIQEDLLMDAAVGYLLVRDALFVLRSVASYDSIVQAYDLLDAATRTITGERAPLFSGFGKKKPVRSEYGFINADTTVEEKKKIVNSNGFKDMLIEIGDINKCVAAIQKSGNLNHTSQGMVAPPQPIEEPEQHSIGLSDDDKKLLAEMRRSVGWNISTPFVSTKDIGTDPSDISEESDNKNAEQTGGNES